MNPDTGKLYEVVEAKTGRRGQVTAEEAKQKRQRESWFAREQRAYLAGLAIGISIGLLVAYLT